MYLIEPWGWEDREYRTAAQQAITYDMAVNKKDRKSIDYFIRDMVKAVTERLMELSKENHLDKMEPEERKAFILKSATEFFGAFK